VLLQTIGQHWIFAPLRGSGLKAAALRGSAWTIFGYGSGRILQLASNLVLTRLLFPEAFGVMALVHVIIIGLHMFSDMGITPSIVQNQRGEDPVFLNTAWTLQIIRGFALWAAACAAGWPAALIYRQPILLPLLCVAGSATAISGFQSFGLATASRNLRFGRLNVVQLCGQFISTGVTVALADWNHSVWSLAVGYVVGAVIQTILSHVAFPARAHAVSLNRESLQALLHFGRWIFFATLVTFLGGQGLRAIQGTLVSSDVLGTISIASMIANTFGDLTTSLIGTVGFPAFAKVYREQPGRVREVLERVRLRILGLTLPSFVLLSFTATPLIHLLYDRRYAAGADYLAIAAISSAFAVVPMLYQNALLASGNSRAHFIIMAFSMVLRITGLLTGFYVGGVDGMLIGIAIGTFVCYFIAAWFAHEQGWLSVRVDLASMCFIFAGAAASFGWHVELR
jgi:O-antigen/teichoic acid export membrane protein